MCSARSLFLALTLAGTSLVPALTAAQAPDAGMPPADEQARRQQVLVRGDDLEVTVGEVEDAIAQQGPGLRARYRNGDELKVLVSSLVRAELLAKEAQRRGYDAQPPVRYLAKDSSAQALVRTEVDEKITPESIAPEDVRAYYEGHEAEFHRPAMRRASLVVLSNEAELEALLPQADKADPRAFAELAKQHSKDASTKAQGGDLGYFAADAAHDPVRDKTQPSIDPRVRAATFKLAEVGATGKLVLGEQRAIVRFSAERPERHVSLEDATVSIRAKLWRERRQKALDQLVGKLRTQDKPQVFTDRIYLISFDDMEKRPSGFVPDPVAPPVQKASAPAKAP